MARASTLCSLLATTGVVIGAFAPSMAKAQSVDASRIAAGFEASAADCEMLKTAVFVEVEGKGVCIRYYLSTAGGATGAPLVFLSGDAPSTVHWNSGRISLEVEPAYNAPSTEDIEGFAETMSKRAKTPAIFLARMGLDGSSGWHGHRRTYFEVAVTTKAMDMIKAKHGFTGYHLAGQSGGGHLIGALLARRTDIGCAVSGSGLLMTQESQLPPDRIPLTMSKIYNPTGEVLRIARNTNTRILVLTDGMDRVVPVENQIGFVRRLNALGGKAKHIFVRAFDSEHHQLHRYALEAAYTCIDGKTDDQIELAMFQMTTRLMAQKVGPEPKPAGPAAVSSTPAPGKPSGR